MAAITASRAAGAADGRGGEAEVNGSHSGLQAAGAEAQRHTGTCIIMYTVIHLHRHIEVYVHVHVYTLHTCT